MSSSLQSDGATRRPGQQTGAAVACTIAHAACCTVCRGSMVCVACVCVHARMHTHVHARSAWYCFTAHLHHHLDCAANVGSCMYQTRMMAATSKSCFGPVSLTSHHACTCNTLDIWCAYLRPANAIRHLPMHAEILVTMYMFLYT